MNFFGENMIRPELIKKIESRKNKKRIDLDNMEITDDEIKEIMENIPNKSDIYLVNLDGNNLTDKGAMILSQYLPDFHQLRELSLQFNQIGSPKKEDANEGLKALFSLQLAMPALKDLSLHGNNVRDVSVIAKIQAEARQEVGLAPK